MAFISLILIAIAMFIISFFLLIKSIEKFEIQRRNELAKNIYATKYGKMMKTMQKDGFYL